MLYIWDETKRASNLAKHGIDFRLAADFEWETAGIVPDPRRSYGETRFIAAGFIGQRLHVMVFTFRGENVRIISLRKANRREILRYEKLN